MGHLERPQVDSWLLGAVQPELKTAGVTVNWGTVPAVTSATTLPGGFVLLAGGKYLRFGQVLAVITGSGKYGPYDPAATDGRQLLARGKCYILNETTIDGRPTGRRGSPSDHPAVLEGGAVWRDRLLATDGAPSLAVGPNLANLEAALPRLRYITWPG